MSVVSGTGTRIVNTDFYGVPLPEASYEVEEWAGAVMSLALATRGLVFSLVKRGLSFVLKKRGMEIEIEK